MPRRFLSDDQEAIAVLQWLRDSHGDAVPRAARGPASTGECACQGSEAADPRDLVEQGTTFNCYIYVVGTDLGGTDFNIMRQTLQESLTHVYPRLDIVFDFRGGQVRISRQMTASERPVSHPDVLSRTSFQPIYSTIQYLADNDQHIRHLHFFTHSGPDCIYYALGGTACSADIRASLGTSATALQKLRAAFAHVEAIKLHGCSYVQEIRDQIRAYCRSRQAATKLGILGDIRQRIERSYAYSLAAHTQQSVWAAALGTGANFNCPNLSDRNIFCVNTSTYSVDLNFYRVHYGQFFSQQSGESIFDRTSHMKYKPALLPETSLLATSC